MPHLNDIKTVNERLLINQTALCDELTLNLRSDYLFRGGWTAISTPSQHQLRHVTELLGCMMHLPQTVVQSTQQSPDSEDNGVQHACHAVPVYML